MAGGLPGRMGELQIWDVASGELDLSIPVSYDTLYGVSWSPDGQLVAVGCTDNTLRAFRVEDGQQVLFQGSHNDWVIDTIFGTEGKYLVSVGRDQTAKLTGVATERFVDNITSITPGALRGGIQSVTRHPFRNEILIGAADGTPQIYRMVRQTKRVIGDNANLIRRFAPMTGRVFGVDYSPDGKRITAASSLDGKGYVNVYASDIDSNLSEELKKIMQKVASSRNQEERKKVEAFWTQGTELIASASFDTALYAVAFHPNGQQVAVGGADGVIRVLDTQSAALSRAFVPVPLQDTDSDALYTLSVSPSSLDFAHAYQSAQLVVQGWTASGESVDLTRDASYELEQAIVALNDKATVTPLVNGSSQLTIRHGGHAAKVPVSVSDFEKALTPDFRQDVNPVISKMGCNAGTCHGAKDGKNGFKLSLRGYDPIYDVRAFTDDLAQAGYVWQFTTLAGFHTNGLATEKYVRRFADVGMKAYVEDVQREEKAIGAAILKHQTWSGAELMDRMQAVATGGGASPRRFARFRWRRSSRSRSRASSSAGRFVPAAPRGIGASATGGPRARAVRGGRVPLPPSSATPVARSMPRRALRRFFLRRVPFLGIASLLSLTAAL